MNNWTSLLDNVTEQCITEFGGLPQEQLCWQPGKDKWSIAQNLNHLIIVNETYYPVFESLLQGTYKPPLIAKSGIIVSLTSNLILKAVKPDRNKKIKTFSMWQPGNIRKGNDIIKRFETHQNLLKQTIESVSKFANTGVVISSPANRNIVYKIETAFDIITFHELRHLEQAKEVLALLKRQPTIA